MKTIFSLFVSIIAGFVVVTIYHTPPKCESIEQHIWAVICTVSDGSDQVFEYVSSRPQSLLWEKDFCIHTVKMYDSRR